MIKYIVFDFDGTLVDSKSVFIEAYNQVAEKSGYKKLEPENIAALRKLGLAERFKYMEIPLYKIPFLTNSFLKRYRQALHQVLLMAGMQEVIGELASQGYQVAIISSNQESIIRQFLTSNQLHHIRSVYCSRNLFGKDKLLRDFLKAYKLKNTEVLYVGDELRDIQACRKAGVRMVWVGWGYDEADLVKNEKPDFVAHTPADILEALALATATSP
jgi:phosphoglycolate phosphatase